MDRRMIYTKFGVRVAQLRKEKGQTQEQLAEAMSEDIDWVRDVESGVTTVRFLDVVEIARALETPLSEIFPDGF